jgi:hypothetical protein
MTKIETLLARLEKVRKAGKGFSACCPAHDDKTASLAITEVQDRILIHCFAGCAPASVLAAVGLELADLFEPGEANPLKPYDRDLALFSTLRRNPGVGRDFHVMKIALNMIQRNEKMHPDDVKYLQGTVDRLLGFAAIIEGK